VQQADLNICLECTQSSSVGVVLLMDVIEHLTRAELFDTLDEVFRILKPGGRCIAHVPNAEGLFGMRIRYGDLTHENAFTPKSAQQVFRTIGFEEVICHEDRPVAHNLKSLVRRIIWDVFTLVPRLLLTAETGETRFVLSQNMLIVAVK
jgi:2-polyprenyl-3-methyl-5-hydroxy-6-metoxy-1,4-benzoquinol methylase